MIVDPSFYVEKILSNGEVPSYNYEMDLADMIRLHLRPLDCKTNGTVNINVLKSNLRRDLDP